VSDKRRAQQRDNEKHDDKLILKICDINQMNFLGKKTFFRLILLAPKERFKLVMTLSIKQQRKEKQTN
jgi:hypothetical protein